MTMQFGYEQFFDNYSPKTSDLNHFIWGGGMHPLGECTSETSTTIERTNDDSQLVQNEL